jgi:hypothetical protein
MKNILAILCLFLTACVPVAPKDISHTNEARNVIGLKFNSKKPLILLGITMDRNYAKRVDFQRLDIPPSSTGPEIIFRKDVPSGILIEITGLYESTGMGSPNKYSVKIHDTQYDSSVKTFLRVSDNQPHGLSAEYFSFVE